MKTLRNALFVLCCVCLLVGGACLFPRPNFKGLPCEKTSDCAGHICHQGRCVDEIPEGGPEAPPDAPPDAPPKPRD